MPQPRPTHTMNPITASWTQLGPLTLKPTVIEHRSSQGVVPFHPINVRCVGGKDGILTLETDNWDSVVASTRNLMGPALSLVRTDEANSLLADHHNLAARCDELVRERRFLLAITDPEHPMPAIASLTIQRLSDWLEQHPKYPVLFHDGKELQVLMTDYRDLLSLAQSKASPATPHPDSCHQFLEQLYHVTLSNSRKMTKEGISRLFHIGKIGGKKTTQRRLFIHPNAAIAAVERDQGNNGTPLSLDRHGLVKQMNQLPGWSKANHTGASLRRFYSSKVQCWVFDTDLEPIGHPFPLLRNLAALVDHLLSHA